MEKENQRGNKKLTARIPGISPSQLGGALIAIFAFQGCIGRAVYREQVRVATINREYDIPELNTYGEWVTINTYGRVWRPYVAAGWQPFEYGHWTYSDVGWVWVSYEPFGWVVYHYGTWFLSPEAGWVWVPGHGAWSPARVEWVQSGDYICWAPLAARGVLWQRPWEGGNAGVWTVVHIGDFTRDNVGVLRVDRSVLAAGHTDRVIVRAPEPRVIEQRTRQVVQRTKVDRDQVGVGQSRFERLRVSEEENHRVEKYKPQVEKEVLKRPDQGEHR